MKRLIYGLLAVLLCAGLFSCTSSKNSNATYSLGLNGDALEYYIIEIENCLALEANPDSGYPAASFASLKNTLESLQSLYAAVKAGEVTSQSEIDSAADGAEQAIRDFKASYAYVSRAAEMYVPGASDLSCYVKLGAPGAFDSYGTISVSFWFKGEEKLNIQRQGSIVSNFISSGGCFYGWEVNTWASDDAGNGGYRLRVSRAFGSDGKSLREPSNDYSGYTSWHHIAYTFDNSTHYTALYLDGVKIGDDTFDSEPKAPGYQVQMCAFKSLTDSGNPKSVSGSMKKLRFWSRALSAEEVKADMTSEVTGSETGLIAAWDFDRTVEDPENIVDKTGNHVAQVLGDKVEWRKIE